MDSELGQNGLADLPGREREGGVGEGCDHALAREGRTQIPTERNLFTFECHGPLAYALQEVNEGRIRRLLVEDPRGYGKSTWATKNRPVHKLVQMVVNGQEHALGGYPRFDNPFLQVDFDTLRYEVGAGDYSLVLGLVVVYGTLLVVFNLIVDVAYSILDPRIAYD